MGARLTEVGLATELNVSRVPVREALAQLVYMGLAVNVPGQGVFLRESDRRDVEDLLELRILYETFAIRKATERGTPKFFGKIEGAVQAMRNLAVEARREKRLGRERLRDSFQAETDFHLSIVEATGNKRLIRGYSDMALLIHTFYCAAVEPPLAFSELVVNYYRHRKIFGAIRRGDPDRAEKAMRDHLQAGFERTLKRFDEKNPKRDEESSLSACFRNLL